jgi:radical SAM superfamily enzyme YgiQ (UPF0313 family)
VKPLIVDALASGKGGRIATRDVIGAGPRAVAGVMEAHGLRPGVMPVEELLKRGGYPDGYDLLLISGMTSDLKAIQRAAGLWRAHHDGPILVGGPAASEPERIIGRTRALAAVLGEGEAALSELIEARLDPERLGGIRGIAYTRGEEISVNPLRPVQGRDVFEKYPASTRVIEDYPLHHAARVYVEVVRGCSNYNRARTGPLGEQCTGCDRCTDGGLTERYDCPMGIPPGCGYCSVPSLYGPPRSKPEHLIHREVEGLVHRGVHRVVLSAPGFLDYGRDRLVDPEPLTDPRSPEPNYEALEGLFESLYSIGEVSDGSVSIMIENIKASLVTERAATILGRYLEGTPVSIGFETGCSDHSRLVGRPDTPAECHGAVRRLRRAGLKPYVYFIHGLPGQTGETVDRTVAAITQAAREGAERVILYRFMSLPWSAFHGCPSGPPAARDRLSGRIHEAARVANRARKEATVGTRLRVVTAEPYDRDPRLTVAYPMKHGPVVLVEGAEGSAGEVMEVTVTSIASERAVRGRPADAMF